MRPLKGVLVYVALSYGLAALVDLAAKQVAEQAALEAQRLAAIMLAWGFARMYTPALASLASALLVDRVSRPGLRDFLGLKVDEVSVRYFLVAPLLALPPLFTALAAELALGALTPEPLARLLPGPLSAEPGAAAALLLVISLLQGYLAALTINALFALGEEIGWRGYLYSALWPRLGPTKATVAVGVLWGLWHYPAALLLGHNYSVHRAEGPLLFTVITTLMSGPMLLMRHRTGSVLPASSFHGAVNAWWGLTLLLAPGLGELQGGLGAVGIAAWAVSLPALLLLDRLVSGKLAGK